MTLQPWMCHESIWLRPGEQGPEGLRVTVQTIDGHRCLESHEIPRGTRHAKWVQIEQHLFPE
jgi:hypothetical protein